MGPLCQQPCGVVGPLHGRDVDAEALRRSSHGLSSTVQPGILPTNASPSLRLEQVASEALGIPQRLRLRL